ncbi:MAG: WG repeat-containing protein [Chitinophagaceae bacterium]|jgi:hypothetical protein|nr:WG repeat-containing protein [Chitinophagaceae bacterium]
MKKLLMLLAATTFVLPLLAQKWAKNYDFVNECICGLSLVGKDKLYGYVDKDGKVVVPLAYQEGLTFNGGYGAVRKGDHWAFLDSTGRFITDFKYTDALGFSQGYAPARKETGWGYVDTLGHEAIPFIYSNARKFSEGLAAVCTKGKELWGFINRKGEVVIDLNLDFADSFTEEGEARVVKKGKMMWIDKYNQKVRE